MKDELSAGSDISRLDHSLSRRRLLRNSGLAMLLGGAAALTSVPSIDAFGSMPSTLSARAFQQTGGQIIYADERPLTPFTPQLVDTTEEIGLMQLICEPLVRLDDKMQLTSALATSWETEQDGTTWNLKLRTGVTFHNGEPFDANAVKFSFDAYREIGERYPWFYLWPDGLPQVEIVDPTTVRLKSTKPVGTTPSNLVLLFMIPPKAGAEKQFANNPIGTGPFKFLSHQEGVRLDLEANGDYWAEPAKIQKLAYRPIPDPSARMAAIQTGDINVAGAIPPDLVEVLKKNSNITIYQVPGIRIAHYPFNFRNTESPLADARVRQALGYAIDGQTIIDTILAGAGQPLKGPVPSTLLGAADLGGYPAPDPGKAKSLLNDAGYPMDHEIDLILAPGEFIKVREVTEAIQAMMKNIGVKMKIEELEEGAYTQRRSGADWELAVDGFSAVNGDPTYFLAWATSATTFGYSNEKTKQVVQQAQETVDSAKRLELLAQAQKLYWDDVPYLWGYTQTNTTAMQSKIQSARPLSTGWIPFQTAEIAG
jgi:ABC-type transport system substrate-binding protein